MGLEKFTPEYARKQLVLCLQYGSIPGVNCTEDDQSVFYRIKDPLILKEYIIKLLKDYQNNQTIIIYQFRSLQDLSEFFHFLYKINNSVTFEQLVTIVIDPKFLAEFSIESTIRFQLLRVMCLTHNCNIVSIYDFERYVDVATAPKLSNLNAVLVVASTEIDQQEDCLDIGTRVLLSIPRKWDSFKNIAVHGKSIMFSPQDAGSGSDEDGIIRSEQILVDLASEYALRVQSEITTSCIWKEYLARNKPITSKAEQSGTVPDTFDEFIQNVFK